MQSFDMQDGLSRLPQTEKIVSEQVNRPVTDEEAKLHIQETEDSERSEIAQQLEGSEQKIVDREKEETPEERRQREKREREEQEKKKKEDEDRRRRAQENIRLRRQGPDGLIVNIDA